MQDGILSHVCAARLQHQSVAMEVIQDRRARVRIPGGRRLHEYANLYVCGRNPMLYKRLNQHQVMCVLSVSIDALDLEGVVITDSNASSDYVRFAAAPDGIRIVDQGRTFAEYWTDQDPIQQLRKKAAKCAEVLVPDRIDPRFIRRAYVSCDQAKADIEALSTGLQVVIDRHLFFM